MSAYYTAKERYGIRGGELLDIFIECTWESEGGKGKEECPF